MSKMIERRRRRKRREEDEEEDDPEPSDEQTEIAKFLRFNCPTKSSNYHSDKVEYFKVSYVLFSVIWLVTAGRHHFWLFPNMTEEHGVLESFVPLYTHVYTGEPSKEDKDHDSDKENNGDNEGNEDTKDNENDLPQIKKEPQYSETEPWIQVTEEDVAQAKEATGNDSDDQPPTQVVC